MGEDAPVEGLLTLIHATWRVKVRPRELSECATTCLFGIVESSGRTTVGRLGDGLMALRRNGDTVEMSDDIGAFADETIGLGLGAGLSSWTHETWASFPPDSALLLATDGVAGDLVPESTEDVIEDLLERYGNRNRGERWMRLSRELFDWVRPGHVDDKTLAMLWRRRSTS
jgi:hypothetical protein